MPGKSADPLASAAAAEQLLLLDENRFAWAALEGLNETGEAPAAGRRVGSRFVYLYGPSGAGKSHFVRQFLHDERRRDPELRVACVTAGEFAAELAEASEARRLDRFQARYRDLDLLICEDLAAIEYRHETQQQLVALMDEILNSGGRLILTSLKSPGELAGVQRRLVNRCHGATCAALRAPVAASRAALLAHFALAKQIPIPQDALDLLAAEFPVSPRELHALLNQLDARARQSRCRIDRDFVRRYVDGEIKPASATLAEIARAVARHFGVTISGLRGQRRAQGVVLPRQCAMFLARQLTAETMQTIAAYFGRRNHTTVIHACRRMKVHASDDPTLRQHLAQIHRALGRPDAGARA
jgi:chromosomal replication initiator protein